MSADERFKLSNSIVFGIVMRKPELCKKCLERILNKKIVKINFPQSEKSLDVSLYAKSIRMDIYCEGENEVYDIEMQNYDDDYISKRGRYYQDLIDLDMIEKGDEYAELKKSIVIFICRSDLFKKGRHIYTFENRCIQDTDIQYDDGTMKIILNTKGTMNDVSLPLKMFLNYIETGEVQDEYTGEIEKEVSELISNEVWRKKIMTLEKEMEYQKWYWQEHGKEKGIVEGLSRAIHNLMTTSNMTLDQAMDALMITGDDRKKYADIEAKQNS